MSAGAAEVITAGRLSAPESGSRHALAARTAGALLGALLLGALFLRIMTLGLRRDEQLYAAPVSLLSDQALYSDFFYNHMPGSAYFFHALGWMTGDAGVLMTARLGVFLFWVALFLAGGALLRWLTRSWSMTAFCLLAIATDPVLLGPAGMAGANNFPTVVLGFLGVLLFFRGLAASGRTTGWIIAAGVTLGLAASFKASGIAFVAPVAIASFLLPLGAPLRVRLRSTVLPLALGGMTAALPTILLFASDPAGFMAHVVGFHTGPHVAYWAANDGVTDDVALGLSERVAMLATLAQSGTVAMSLLAVTLGALHALSAPGRVARSRPAMVAVAIAASVLAANSLLALVPAPSFPQYFAPIFVSMPLLGATLFSALDPSARDRMRHTLLGGCAVMLLLAAPRLAVSTLEATSFDNWTPVELRRSGVRIAERLAEQGIEGKVATLAPLYPLEGGLPVYAELATGQFAYRSVPFASAELRSRFTATGPGEIEAMLDADPPAALLIGFEPGLEAPMLRFAERRGYRLVEDFAITDRYGTGRLYMRP